MKYKVIGVSETTGEEEVIGVYATLQEAQAVQFKCIEGDDDSDPYYYEIERE